MTTMLQRLAARLRRLAARAWASPRVASFCFFFSALMLFTSPRPPFGDAVGYFALTDSLARFGSWEAPPEVALFDDQRVPNAEGKRYAYFPPGQSLVQLPLYFMGTKVASAFDDGRTRFLVTILSLRATQAGIGALAGVLLMHLVTASLGFGALLSFATAALYVFGTQAFPYAKLNYAEALQALLLIAIACVLFARLSARSLPMLAACCGGLVLAKWVNVLFLPAFFGFFLYQGGRAWLSPRRILVAAAAAAPFVALFCYWNYIRTGSVIDYGRPPDLARLTATMSLRHVPHGLASLFGWPLKNVFLYNPILVLAVVGAWRPRIRRYALFAVGTFLLQSVVFGSFDMGGRTGGAAGWGNWAWGPRYPMPFLILLLPLVAACLEGLRARWATVNHVARWSTASLVSAVVGASIYVQVLAGSYSFATVFNLCPAYEHFRTQLPAPLPECLVDIRASDLAIHHYLLWHATPERLAAGDIPPFPWGDEGSSTTIAHVVFRTFSPEQRRELFTRDYLFFFGPRFTAGQTAVGWLLLLAAMASFARSVQTVRRPSVVAVRSL